MILEIIDKDRNGQPLICPFTQKYLRIKLIGMPQKWVGEELEAVRLDFEVTRHEQDGNLVTKGYTARYEPKLQIDNTTPVDMYGNYLENFEDIDCIGSELDFAKLVYKNKPWEMVYLVKEGIYRAIEAGRFLE